VAANAVFLSFDERYWGYTSEDIARGIDETMIRQPLGVVGIITPFNFPAVIPLWFLPYVIACGSPVLLKPSEKVPMTAVKFVRLLEETGLPPGVVNLVHGGREAVDALVDHPVVRAISFVGSSPVARHVILRTASRAWRSVANGPSLRAALGTSSQPDQASSPCVETKKRTGVSPRTADPASSKKAASMATQSETPFVRS